MMASVVDYLKTGYYSTHSIYKQTRQEARKFRTNTFIKFMGFPIRFFITFILWSFILTSNTNDASYYLWYYTGVFLIMLMYPYVRMANAIVGLDIFYGGIIKYTAKGIPYWSVRLAEWWSIVSFYIPTVFGVYVLAYSITHETFHLSSLIAFFYLLIISSLMQLVLWTIVGMGAFWLEQTQGFSRLLMLVQDLFTGALIPLFMLPNIFKEINEYLPFQYFVFVPIDTLMNPKETTEILRHCIGSSLWLVAFLIIAYLIWNKGMKRYMSPL